MCTEQNSSCLNYPNIDTSNFKGKIIHASKYDQTFMNECMNKKVLIYGGSDTAFDISLELSNNIYRENKDIYGNIEFGYAGSDGSINNNKTIIYISMRKGRWIQRRTFGGYGPADMFYSRTLDFLIKNTSKYLTRYVFTPNLEFWWGKNGHGIKEWVTNVGYLNGYYIKTADILPKVSFGEIIPLKDVVTINSTNIITIDDKIIDIDIIIFATGYTGLSCYKFISDYIKNGNYNSWIISF